MDKRSLLHYDLEGKSPLPALGRVWSVKVATKPSEAQKLAESQQYPIGIVSFPATPALESVQNLVASAPVEWIALTSSSCLAEPRMKRFISQSFYDFHTLPADRARLAVTLGRLWGMAQLKLGLVDDCESPSCEHAMVGSSPQIRALFRTIRKAADVDAAVLLSGESGTGKELAARAIHQRSLRAKEPFVAVNCAALPSALIHSELFGHERGSFTGAHRRNIGRIEAAAGGTLFLDEIGDLPAEQQVHLLRFLQEKTIERIGGNQTIAVDVRVLAATNVNLEQAVESGRFREDLYYRLNVLRVNVPSLRERKDDIRVLARYFFDRFRSERRGNVRGFSDAAVIAMERHDWPGNVRELINLVRRAVLMCDGRLITANDLGLQNHFSNRNIIPLEQCRDNAEKDAIIGALWSTGHNVTQAAAELEISRMTLYRLIEKYAINAYPLNGSGMSRLATTAADVLPPLLSPLSRIV